MTFQRRRIERPVQRVMVDNGRAEGYERAVPHGAFLVKRGRMRVAQRSIPALLFVASGAVAVSCGGDDFCSQGSYECTGGTQPSSGAAGTAGTSGDGLGGSTGTGGSATAGFPSSGGSGGFGNAEGGAPTGGTAGLFPTGGTTGTSGEAGTSGEGGEAGHGPSSCDPESPTAGCLLSVGHAGIYVAPPSAGGNDANDGTQSAPVATLGHALELPAANTVPIFVCAGTYQEHLEITLGGIDLHGAYTCQNAQWTYDPTAPSRLAPTTKDEALRVKDVTGLTVTDMELVSANADPKTPGASSVAVFVSGSTQVMFVRDHIIAGDGVRGADGQEAESNYSTMSLDGNPGTESSGGDSNVCSCADGTTSTGGLGGAASTTPTGGGAGLPPWGGGLGGTVGSCGSGGTGHDGAAPEAVSDAAGANALGSVDQAGWAPAPGGDGLNGKPGQGGGGGGGATNGGGGGGACGGCGGAGGRGGHGGGSSIAILSLSSTITLNSCYLESRTAGQGGDGKIGEPGQSGGMHANGHGAACPGGAGAQGGNGGAGGGGAGGVSVGVVSATSTINIDEGTTYTPGTPGAGGLGAGTENSGLPGVTQETLTPSQ